MKQFLIRSVQPQDLTSLHELAKLAGDGMTSLPADKDYLEQKIYNSKASFEGADIYLDDKQFFLVLEDLEKNKIIGTSCVYSLNQHPDQAFHSYKIEEKRVYSQTLEKEFMRDYLVLDENREPTSLIGTLFLHPDYRSLGLAKWLSRIRYMLIKARQDDFQKLIFAEIRGWISDKGYSPYWENLGKKYFGMDFLQAEALIKKEGYQFIYELMPKEPIPLFLLDNDALEYIGKPHDSSVAAMKMLKDEGFEYHNKIDFFDGGPQFSVKRDDIKTYQSTKMMKPKDIVPHSQKLMVASNLENDFRSLYLAPSETLGKDGLDLLEIKNTDDLFVSE